LGRKHETAYFACKARAIIPAAIGADADVPVNDLSHPPPIFVVYN
jgi:hypothetical protein